MTDKTDPAAAAAVSAAMIRELSEQAGLMQQRAVAAAARLGAAEAKIAELAAELAAARKRVAELTEENLALLKRAGEAAPPARANGSERPVAPG
jgi:hypothetical protein